MRGGGLVRRFLPGLHPSRGARAVVRPGGGGGGGGVAPTITVAPVLTWTVAHGSSPTITPPTYTGDPATITYDLIRLPSTTVLSGVDLATAQAYVSDRSTDLGPDWKITATATNASGSDSADSNTVTWDRSSLPLSGAHSGEGLVLADSGTTVDEWSSSYGAISTTRTAPTAAARFAYSATGGVGGRPLVTAGVQDELSGTVTRGAAWADCEAGAVGVLTAGRIVIDYSALGAFLDANNSDNTLGGRWNGTIVTAGAITPGAASHLSIRADASTIEVLQGNSVVNSGASPGGTIADGDTSRLGSTTTTIDIQFAYQAWYIGAKLTADQRLDHRALLTYLTGVAS